MAQQLTEHGHIPVMRDRIVDLLKAGVRDAHKPAVLVDGTLGAGGHTEAVLKSEPQAIVIGLDRDPQALEIASQRLADYADRFFTVQTRFDSFDDALEQVQENPAFPVDLASQGISGFLFDLGVSSMQLDQTDRGFAYSVDAPLDMRMDPSLPVTAADILNTYSHGDLARVLKTYGDERFAGKIASAVLEQRETEPFDMSGPLVELLYREIPAASRRTGGHPAKRTFQALRIEVNAELLALENVIPQAVAWLHAGANGIFMSYQSLEDKIVKTQLKELTMSTSPPGLPVDLPDSEPHFALVTKGSERATEQEIEQNPRSAPARVRAITRAEHKDPTEFPHL